MDAGMILDVAAGLACGLATAVVSEAVLRVVPNVVERDLFRVLLVGGMLRALWVLALVAWILTGGSGDPRLIVPALMLGYLAAQVFEGVRYTRYFERC